MNWTGSAYPNPNTGGRRRIGTARRRGWWADTNLVRLYRSLEKVTLLTSPDSFTDQDWHSLLAGYRESAGLPQPLLA